MLKIKDNIDLKELEKFIKQHKYKKFGIWKQHNMNTGELKYIWIGRKWDNGCHSYRISYDNDIRIIKSAETEDLDMLYDLIKADLIEKVEDK